MTSVWPSKEYFREHNARSYAARRVCVDEIKRMPCLDCHRTFPPECMDFDHVGGEKLNVVAHLMGASWARLLDEIVKCDLICSNCHRIRTRERLTKW